MSENLVGFILSGLVFTFIEYRISIQIKFLFKNPPPTHPQIYISVIIFITLFRRL